MSIISLLLYSFWCYSDAQRSHFLNWSLFSKIYRNLNSPSEVIEIQSKRTAYILKLLRRESELNLKRWIRPTITLQGMWIQLFWYAPVIQCIRHAIFIRIFIQISSPTTHPKTFHHAPINKTLRFAFKTTQCISNPGKLRIFSQNHEWSVIANWNFSMLEHTLSTWKTHTLIRKWHETNRNEIYVSDLIRLWW